MSDEAKAAEAAKAPQTDPVEELAKELGWNSEYDGDDKKTARDFILNSKEIQKTQRDHAKKLMEKLERTQGQVEELQNGFSEFESHIRQTAAAEVGKWKQRVADLKAERKAAVRDGDVDAVERIERKLEAAENDKPVAPPKTSFPGQKEVAKWVNTTDWYNPSSAKHNSEAKAYADAIYSENILYDQRTGQQIGLKLSVPRMLQKIEREVKKEFPELFESAEVKQPAPKAPLVEAGGTRKAGGAKTKYTSIKDLPEDMRASADRLINKMGVISLEQYVKDQKAQGFLE